MLTTCNSARHVEFTEHKWHRHRTHLAAVQSAESAQ